MVSTFQPTTASAAVEGLPQVFDPAAVAGVEAVVLFDLSGREPGQWTLVIKDNACRVFGVRVATTLGYGPRFLHSTGQFHKGGPPKGVFIQITVDEAHEAKIPGEDYSFAILIRAQALGDLESLRGRNLPVVRLHLAEPEEGLAELRQLIA